MKPQAEFKELLALLNAHEVAYVIVGGYALAFHGAPRFTGDIDIFVRPDPQNAERVLMAINRFGFGSLGLTTADFEAPGQVVQLGFPPLRIDLMTSLSGVSWEDADQTKVAGLYGDVSVAYLGRPAFIKTKRATGRKKDLADLEALGEE